MLLSDSLIFVLQETSKDEKSKKVRLKPLKQRDLTLKNTETKPSSPPPGGFTDVSSSRLTAVICEVFMKPVSGDMTEVMIKVSVFIISS